MKTTLGLTNVLGVPGALPPPTLEPQPRLADDPMAVEALTSAMGHSAIYGGPPSGMLSQEILRAGKRVEGVGATLEDPTQAPKVVPLHDGIFGPRLGQRVQAVTQRFADGAGKAFGAPDENASERTGSSTLEAMGSLARGLGRAGTFKNIDTAYQELLPALAEHAALPDMTRERVRMAAMGVRAVDFALADQVEAHAADRLGYLYETMPKPPGPMEERDGWVPDPADLHTWARRVTASERPEVMLDELRDGTLVPETIETVQRLYPAHFAKVQEGISERAMNGDPIPYHRRLAISLLLGGDDPDLRPEAIAAAQQRLAEVKAEAMEPNKPPGTPTKPSKTFSPSKISPDTEPPTQGQRALAR